MDAQTTRHPTDKALQAYGLGKLGDSSAESVSAHLESCPDCRRRVAEISSDSFLGRLRDAKAPTPSPHPVVSSTGGPSMLDGAAALPADSLPPGLAGHPDYEILRELGRGGMGVVYLARNKLMGRSEVLKVVHGLLVSRNGMLDRFLVEIRNAAMLHHPNIVTAYSALRFGEDLVLAMEYVEGLDLGRVVRARGPLPVTNACYYVHQVAMGLQHAHEHGMVHRDIKPGNLMLARLGNKQVVKILDFGLAKARREQSPAGALTQTGQLLGTPAYMAPEQMSDPRRADIRADIYSLGCTLYFLLTGKPPFEGKDLHDILQAHHSMEAVPLNLARPEVPVPLAVIVATMMAKEPERRFQTPRDVSQALVPFLKKQNPTPRGPEPAASGSLAPGGFQLSQGTGWSADPPAATFPAPSAPRPPTERVPGPTPSDSEWALPIQIEPEEDLSKEVQSWRTTRGTPAWLWPAAAGVMGLLGLLGLAVALGISIGARKNQGAIVQPASPIASGEQVPAQPRARTGSRVNLDPPAPANDPIAPTPAREERPSPPKTAASGPIEAPRAREERPSPPKTAAEPPRTETVLVHNESPKRPDSLDRERPPGIGPSAKDGPEGPSRDREPSVADQKVKSPAELTPEEILESRGLKKSGTFYVVAPESEFAAAWHGVVPHHNLMDAARGEFVQAMQIAAYAQELDDTRINLQAYITNLNNQTGRVNRDQRVLLQSQIQEANANLNSVLAEMAKVRTRLVSPARRQELHDRFMQRRKEFLEKSSELRPILDKLTAEYDKLKQDAEVRSALKTLKERKKANISLGPSTALKNLVRQLSQAEEEVSLNPDAYRRRKKPKRLEGRETPKDKAGAMSR